MAQTYSQAPDGGPVSHFVPKAKPIPTVLVRRKADGHVVRMNESAYDPELHELVGAEPEPAPVPEPEDERVPLDDDDEDEVVLSHFTEIEMATMTVPALLELPEVAHVAEPASVKTELISQILNVRALSAAAE